MSRAHLVGAGALALAVALAGCTVGTTDPEPSTGSTRQAAPATDSVTEAAPSPTRDVGDVSPEELSADVLAAAGADGPALGTGTVTVTPPGVTTTLDVLEVRPVDGATLVRLRLTAEEEWTLSPTSFASDRFGTINFVRDVYLDDAASGTRLLPLQFDDHRPACVCPYKPLVLGSEPTVVTTLFDALPEGAASVDVRLAGSDLAVAGVPVDG